MATALVFETIGDFTAGSTGDAAIALGYHSKGDEGGGDFYWDDSSTGTANGGTIFGSFSPSGRWKRIKLRNASNVREWGLLDDGTDQTTRLNQILSDSEVEEVVFDKGDFTVNGTIDVQDKILVFKNGARLIGSGTIENFYIESDDYRQCLGATLSFRNIKNPKISALWLGAVNDGITDNSDVVQNIIDTLFDTYSIVIYFPEGNYKFGTSLTVDKSCKIIGDIGYNGNNPSTIFTFDTDILGLSLVYNGMNNVNTELENLLVTQTTVGTNSTAHGIYANTYCKFKNVVVNDVAGNGFHLYGNTTSGNLDHSIFESCFSTNCENGFFVDGTDANLMLFIHASAVFCRHWGIYDKGFLGNTWIQPHLSYNGRHNDVIVSYGELYYQAINPISTSNVNHQPDISPTYWRTTTVTEGAAAWNSAKDYSSGGTFWFQDENAKNLILNPYTEEGQPLGMVASRSLVLGGLLGSGFTGGVHFYALFGKLYLNSAGVIFNSDTSSLQNTFRGQYQLESNGAPLYLNSLNSNTTKILFQDNGVAAGYFGAGLSDGYGFLNKDGNPSLEINQYHNAHLYGSLTMEGRGHFKESTNPGAAGTGYSWIYPKSDGHWYIQFSNAIEKQLIDNYAAHSITSADSPYTIAENSGEVVILADAKSGTITINLPTAAGNTCKYNIKKTDSSSNIVTIDANGSQTIDGALTLVLANQYDATTLLNNNSNWFKF